jgi:fatty-acyl-CoA synthase
MNERHFPFWPAMRPKTFPIPITNVANNLAVTAARFPDQPAIVYYDTPISYGRLWADVEALAGYLEHEAGVRRGDRVLLYMQNSPQFVIGYYAILRANAVVVPLNPMLVSEELAEYVADAGAQVALAAQEIASRLLGCTPAPLRRVVVATYSEFLERDTDLPVPPMVVEPRRALPSDAFVAWSAALECGARPSPIVTGGDDMALLPYTSGTTGRPKGCVHTHRSMQTTIWSTAMWRTGMVPGARVLSALPYFHVTGMTGDMNGSMLSGATIVMLSRWDAASALALVERYRCTGMTLITAMVVDMLSQPTYRAEALASLMAIGGGGAPLPAAIGRELTDRLGLNYLEGYGMTETIAMTHANPGDRTKLQCLGIPTFGVDSRVIDPETLRELPPGETGEIITHGSQVMREYWNQPEATAEAFIEFEGKRFLRTGDLGYMDDEGYFFLVDRLKRMVNAGGFKVWPAEVETKLYAHPAIKEACIIASSDARKGECVKAVVVLRDGAHATEDEIIAWSRDKMAAYKVPSIVTFASALPRGATGKVNWRLLQEEDQAQGRALAATASGSAEADR